jgi:hypothetical protein
MYCHVYAAFVAGEWLDAGEWHGFNTFPRNEKLPSLILDSKNLTALSQA